MKEEEKPKKKGMINVQEKYGISGKQLSQQEIDNLVNKYKKKK